MTRAAGFGANREFSSAHPADRGWEEATVGLESVAASQPLADAMAGLPKELRVAIMLRQAGRAFEEIAVQLGQTEAETRQLWGRAVLELGKRMRQHD